MTHPLLQQACAQSEQCIAAALQAPCRTKSKLSARGTLANAAPRAARVDGNTLARWLDLSDTWFRSVTCEGGFLNFLLSDSWYDAVLAQPPRAQTLPELPEPPTGKPLFPALIHGEDWCWAKLLGGVALRPERVALQGRDNAGWFVRCTAKRLATLFPRAPHAPILWTERTRALVRQLAAFDADASAKAQALALVALSDQLWACRMDTLPQSLNAFALAVFSIGRATVLHSSTAQNCSNGLQKIHPYDTQL